MKNATASFFLTATNILLYNCFSYKKRSSIRKEWFNSEQVKEIKALLSVYRAHLKTVAEIKARWMAVFSDGFYDSGVCKRLEGKSDMATTATGFFTNGSNLLQLSVF